MTNIVFTLEGDALLGAFLTVGLTVAGVFILRRKCPDHPRPYRTWGHPVTPALYILGCCAILGGLLVYRPSYTWPGLVLVLLGLPLYALVEKNKHTR